MSHSIDLSGRVALVIGGSGAIGGAIARGLAEAGAQVAIAGRDAVKVEKTVAAIKAGGGDALACACDANDEPALGAVMERLAKAGGRFDILINSQGTTFIKPAVEFDAADYDTIMATNLKSVFFACLAAREHFVAQGGGAIVNIASLAAHRGWPRAVVYGMSKHGIIALTQGLAAEWAGDNVRVNAISPGYFMTDLNRDRMGPERKQRALQRTPMARFGEVEELAGAALFLVSDAAGFVTGIDIAVDGGYLAAGI